MAKSNQQDNESHVIGIIAGVAVAIALVATGAVIWKIVSDRQKTDTKEE